MIQAARVPDIDELQRAYACTRAVTVETPLLESPRLAKACGAERVFVKPESLQRTGSFKFRGAYWRLRSLNGDERERGVVAYSSGNFAQGLAAAAQMAGVHATIVMPIDAPAAKRAGAEAFGAHIVTSDHGDRPREEVASEIARRLSAENGLTLLHPFDDPSIVAGQGGAGLEALDQFRRMALPVPDIVTCCVGGGGLIGGVALAFHHTESTTQVIAAEPVGYDGLGQSLRRGDIVRLSGGRPTICDALQATAPGAAPFAAARAAGVVGVSVPDAAVIRAMVAVFEDLKLVLEPSGAVAIAALDGLGERVEGKTVLAFATGGNVALDDFVRITQTAPSAP